MLRVVWIVPGFSSNQEDWCIPALLDLARAVARRCDLKIVAMRYPYRRDRYRIANATVYSIGGAHRGPRYTPGIWRDTARTVREIPCDLLHAFWAYEPGLVAAWFRPRLPAVISLAGGELISMPEIQYGLMRRMRTRTLIRWALRRARVVTAGSPYLVEHAQAALSLPAVRHIPLGIDLRRWPFSSHNDVPRRYSMSARSSLSKDRIFYSALCRVCWAKCPKFDVSSSAEVGSRAGWRRWPRSWGWRARSSSQGRYRTRKCPPSMPPPRCSSRPHGMKPREWRSSRLRPADCRWQEPRWARSPTSYPMAPWAHRPAMHPNWRPPSCRFCRIGMMQWSQDEEPAQKWNRVTKLKPLLIVSYSCTNRWFDVRRRLDR